MWSTNFYWRGTAVPLTEQEFRLLSALASHPGAVLRYAELFRQGWANNEDVDVSRLRVAIARIRKKLSSVGMRPNDYFFVHKCWIFDGRLNQLR